MRLSKHRRSTRADMNMTPMIDIVFLCRHKSGTPAAIDPDEVAAVQWLTAHGCLRTYGRVAEGETVLIHGQDPVLAHTDLARRQVAVQGLELRVVGDPAGGAQEAEAFRDLAAGQDQRAEGHGGDHDPERVEACQEGHDDAGEAVPG